MIYIKELDVPANTTIDNPCNVELGLVQGVITEVNILFPIGCRGLVGVRIYDFEHIVWPSNPDHWLIADGETIEWQDDYMMSGYPNVLRLEGYNLDDSYTHTVYFRFVALPLEKANILQKLLSLWKGES